MKTITHTELANIIRNIPGTVIMGIQAATDARARKTGNPHGPITKVVRAVGIVGANYAGAVARESGADFKADALPWGSWDTPSKLIRHNGALYLRTQTRPGNRRAQAARVLRYESQDGKRLRREDVKPFLPAPSVSRKQQDAGLETVKEQVWVRTYSFESLRKVRIQGRTYKVTAG
jgi:hypothetical protein